MHNIRKGLTAMLVAGGLTMATALPASAATIEIREDDFVAAASDTRATGHYDFLEEGLHVWTEGNTSTDKVAEYFELNKALAVVGEPSMTWFGSDAQPGIQMMVDFDGVAEDNPIDGILIGEKVYNGDWWLNNAAEQFVKDGAPNNSGGSGSQWHGTLDEWRASFPDAQVILGGFSLGSGVKGDGVLRDLTYGEDTYVFTDKPEAEEPTVVPVEGHADAWKKGKNKRTAVVRMWTEELGENEAEGEQATFRITVNNRVVFTATKGAGTDARWTRTFDYRSGKHVVRVFVNGVRADAVTVTTGVR